MAVATTLRFDEKDKAEATDILRSMGITLNGYLNMSIKQLLNQRKIPFEIVPADERPNEATHRAMVAAEAKSMGLIPDDGVAFDDADEAMSWLDSE